MPPEQVAFPGARLALLAVRDGAGVIDKDRAVAEVKANSKIGRALVEIEQRVLHNVISNAADPKAPQK